MTRRLASRLDAVQPSATLAMTQKAAELRATGRKVYAFGVGEPDFLTPELVREAAAAAIAKSSHYTPVTGTASLKAAICAATTRDRGWTPSPDLVTVSVGAKHALFNLAMVLCEPGDEVVIPAPYWVSYPEQVRLFGGVPRIVETRAEDGWRMTPDALRAALGPKTKAVILCSPSNPTGAAYDARELRALADVLANETDAYIITDEIYGELVYDGFEYVSLGQLAPELAERLIVVDGVSKTYAMTGWRIGWSIAPPAVTKALAKVQGQSTTNPTAVAQAAAEAALLGPRDDVRRMRDAFASRRKVMVDGLNAIPGVRCEVPRGAFYAFPDVTGLYGIRHGDKRVASANDVSLWQLDVCGIAAVAGEAFGAPGHVRYSYATSEETIREALAALANAVARAERG
ncbi:MAG: pyridoxal phosphate-dependent aminotransferase [Sorangiineae bacterium]|nr:pyridoxal phosphate-dependent aminotransferase [Polyangiaceae bacterium]MEB2323616.1 pyridoxal phosphate-dependent aminotransferase [Sorangiineae bacterium]